MVFRILVSSGPSRRNLGIRNGVLHVVEGTGVKPGVSMRLVVARRVGFRKMLGTIAVEYALRFS